MARCGSNRLDQGDEEGRGGGPRRFRLPPDKGEFACPVNGDEAMAFAFGGPDVVSHEVVHPTWG